MIRAHLLLRHLQLKVILATNGHGNETVKAEWQFLPGVRMTSIQSFGPRTLATLHQLSVFGDYVVLYQNYTPGRAASTAVIIRPVT